MINDRVIFIKLWKHIVLYKDLDYRESKFYKLLQISYPHLTILLIDLIQNFKKVSSVIFI